MKIDRTRFPFESKQTECESNLGNIRFLNEKGKVIPHELTFISPNGKLELAYTIRTSTRIN